MDLRQTFKLQAKTQFNQLCSTGNELLDLSVAASARGDTVLQRHG
jgi:hypothetical protein